MELWEEAGLVEAFEAGPVKEACATDHDRWFVYRGGVLSDHTQYRVVERDSEVRGLARAGDSDGHSG